MIEKKAVVRLPGQTLGNNPITLGEAPINKRGHADVDAWKRSKNHDYRNKIAAQIARKAVTK